MCFSLTRSNSNGKARRSLRAQKYFDSNFSWCSGFIILDICCLYVCSPHVLSCTKILILSRCISQNISPPTRLDIVSYSPLWRWFEFSISVHVGYGL
jgi:hypothetical protein